MAPSSAGLSRTLMTALAAAFCLVVPLGGVAVAQKSDQPVVANVGAISFTELGRGTDVLFSENDEPVNVSLPIPDGLTATALVGTITAPTDFSRGWIEVSADGRPVSRIDFDAGQVGQGLPVSVPLAGLPVVDRSIVVSMIGHLVPVDDRCYDRSQYQPLALRGTAIVYDGAEQQPSTVSNFFPPILRKATIFLADSSSPAQQSAALLLSTSIVNRYGSQPDAVVLAELPAGQALPDNVPGLFERNILLGDEGEGGIDLVAGPSGSPVLRVVGDDKSLVPQVNLLAANFSSFWAASQALAAPEKAVAEISRDVVSVGDLKLGTLTASGLEHIELLVPFSQSQLGRAMKNVSVRMIGTYVPMPSTRSAELSFSVGDRSLDSRAVDNSGRFDVEFTIPEELVTRDMTITAALDVAGDFQCGTSHGSSLTIDPASTITSNLANPPIPGGFQSLPQSMLPTIEVGTTRGDFSDIVRAQRVLVQMQRLSYLPLQPRVQSFADAASSPLPAVLIAADGTLPAGIDIALPMETADQGLLRLRGLEFNASYGSIQVAAIPNHEIVVLTSNGDATDVDNMLNWLEVDKTRFGKLSGDVLVAPRDVAPFDISVNVAPSGSSQSSDENNGMSRNAIGVIMGGTALLIILAVGGVLVTRRRSK
ncbi:hypothetical protein [Rhodococcus globerulus]|uniref:hypothetical protein n=1 Tax=Rhodococcus globerulus TaxID=33008 RepID=UPI000A98A8EB|nr:hypothetical protein [Rhodococcus globerulus]